MANDPNNPYRPINTTDYSHPRDPNLNDLHSAMEYNLAGQPVLRAHIDGVTLQGDVLVDAVKLWDGTNTLQFDAPTNDGEAGQASLPAEAYNMVFNGSTWDRMRGNIADGVLTQISNDYLAISKDTNANSDSNRIYVNATGTVSLSAGTTVEATQGTDPWIISKNTTANSASNPINVAGTFTLDQTAGDPTLVKYINGGSNLQLDMTERLRVAPPTQSWWYAPTVDKDGDLRYIESFSGTGASSMFVQNLATIRGTSGTDANGSFVRISRRRHKMRPGVGMQYKTSLSWHAVRTNVTKRAGMFTNFNGIFFEVTDDLYCVIRRRLTDGTLVEKRIARTDFSHDKLDGTGDSGFDFRSSANVSHNLSGTPTKTTVVVNSTLGTNCYDVEFTCSDTSTITVGERVAISGITPKTYNTASLVVAKTSTTITVSYAVDPGAFVSMSSATAVQSAFLKHYVWGIDFSGSRTNAVRFFIEGRTGPSVLHIENFAGQLSTPFENAPAISTRYEVINTGVTEGNPAISMSSEVVNVEAELELNPGFGVARNNTYVEYIKTQTDEFAILGLALRAGEPYQRADIQLQGVQIQDIANVNPQNSGVFYWRLLFNPTLGGTIPTPTNIGKTARQWAFTSATTFTGGIELLSGYTTSTGTIDARTALNFLNLGSNITYTDSDIIVLVVKQLVGGTANARLVALFNFIESL